MKSVVQGMIFSGCLALIMGCSAAVKPSTFTLTADLPSNFAYTATVHYSQAKDQSCFGEATERVNEEWRTDYKANARIDIHKTVNGCDLVMSDIGLYVKAPYGPGESDSATAFASIIVRDPIEDKFKSGFSAAGESDFYGACQSLFLTREDSRRLVKVLECKSTDAQGTLTFNQPFSAMGMSLQGHPFGGYTLEELPGKTVRLKIKLVEEKPYIEDTWVKVAGGWKRCMGKGFEDEGAFCSGNHVDFSTFKMSDGRSCTIYPGCNENKE
ncbi:hypothetical protein BI292_05105 [Pseudomonas sp. 43NM1]|uniref:hypothetical protein n=1 Tax=Pseudomonas sp. 43NM1 TaxID=1904755 RepID=UPI000C327CCA|nr:hypothetical protein [Pseudomonas sp. 43NM1]PKH14630.1 hypothetical protein BI292_05105 [Pseudomonas sp. 43NM1]